MMKIIKKIRLPLFFALLSLPFLVACSGKEIQNETLSSKEVFIYESLLSIFSLEHEVAAEIELGPDMVSDIDALGKKIYGQYFTEHGLEEASRVQALPLSFLVLEDISIEAKEIKSLQQNTSSSSKESYSFELRALIISDAEKETDITITGELNLIEVDGAYKFDYLRSDLKKYLLK